jgi:hypothetical protein
VSAIILAMSCLLSMASAAQDKDTQRQQGQSNGKRQQAVSAPTPVKPTTYAKQSDAAQPQCIDEAGAKRDCDTASAQATIYQARYARWQAIAGFIGVAFGLLTLIVAGVAAFFAERAAHYTKQSAEEAALGVAEAKNTVAIARDTLAEARTEANQRLRAYLHPEPIKFAEEPNPFAPKVVEVKFINFGETPAMNVGVMTSYRVLMLGQNIADAFENRPAIPRGTGRAIAQKNHIFANSEAISTQDIGRVMAGERELILIARVEYTDIVRNEEHVTQECVRLTMRSVGEPDEQGNRKVFPVFIDIPDFYVAT